MIKNILIITAMVFGSSCFLNASANPFTRWFGVADKQFAARGPLPVVLVGFTVTPDADKTVTVSWTTQQETNSSRFVVERSVDAFTWLPIGTVAAKGSSSQVSSYSFKDISALDGITYYRLKVVSKDGDYGYTQIEITRISLEKKFILFPVPAKDYVNIYIRESAPLELTIRLITLYGSTLQVKKVNGGKGETVSLPVQDYPGGIYLVKISASDGTEQVSKLLITH
jgi:hypothetical protein